MKEAGGRRGKTARNAERREGGSRKQDGRWRRRMGLSYGVPRTVLGEFRAPRAARRGQLQRGKELSPPPHWNFTSGQKTLEMPAELVHLEEA